MTDFSEGSYRCKCADGYKGSGYKDECEDANECTPGLNECPHEYFKNEFSRLNLKKIFLKYKKVFALYQYKGFLQLFLRHRISISWDNNHN